MYTRKQRREIYLKAAKLMFNYKDPNYEKHELEGHWMCCCPAIGHVVGPDGEVELMVEFYDLFRPEDTSANRRWYGGFEDKEARIFAMLLCSAMCEGVEP